MLITPLRFTPRNQRSVNIIYKNKTPPFTRQVTFSKASSPLSPLLSEHLSDLDDLTVNVTIEKNSTTNILTSSQTNVQSKTSLDVLYFGELVSSSDFVYESNPKFSEM